MKIAICAGKEEDRLLREWMNAYAGGKSALTVDTFVRREDLLYHMKKVRYNAVIIALPGAIGMETAVGARQFTPEAALVWASDESTFIAESYRLRATMFLSLPLVKEQVQEALRRVGIVSGKGREKRAASHQYIERK